MPMIKIWIHLIWATKNRDKLIAKELKPKLIEHIKSNAKQKEIWIDSVNCVSDHIHLLISLGSEQTISKVVMLIKGESSFWVNKNKLIPGKFEWQDDYMAYSVSDSIVKRVRNYIANQEEHHKVKSFGEEYENFMNEAKEKLLG
ncbi:MAG: IS200/IS605 family transposase [Stygiobacter sp.]|nr:MAG: transposase [Stygiobacter sp. RIFOXYB2_FULL_37_11]OGV15480.1 MAG: transposase [Stygiobacter sp. RIFOXYC2_FULL_38_25]OGV18237.1 MAG: transposase [Stygiobacter sp. RIFOXYA2_FULL_38_8]OGV80594.1 MAG: transposase [Stygiobacter sp. GWF2_38_21]RJQ61210.1 MAG: IS200/IS605 family transposase [Stygiobacter sp.]